MMKVTASIIFSVSSFISLIFMARYAGEAYGMMMWGMSFVATFNAALDMGFHATNIKKVSEGKDISKCVSTQLAIRIVTSTVTVGIVLLSSLLMGQLGVSFPAEFWMVTGVFLLYYILDNLLHVMTGTFIGRMDIGKESAVLTASYIVRSACLIIFAVLGASAVLLSLGYVAGAVCALIISFVLFRSLKVRLVRPAFFREYVSFAAPMSISVILFAVVSYIDKVLIGAFHDEMEVGYYAAAAGVVFALISIGTVMNTLLLSHMSRLMVEGRKEDAKSTLWKTQKYLAALIFPATAFLLILGDGTAVALFGEGFADSGPVLSVLALGIYLTVLSGILSHVLLSMNQTARYGRVATVYAVVTILLFLMIIPGRISDSVSGAVGAALALVIGSAVFVILLTVTARRIGAPGIYPRTYIHILAAAVLAILLYAVRTHLEPHGIIQLALLAVMSVALYLGILLVVKEITRSDIRFIRETLDPRNIYEDLMDEMNDDR
jgi:O-antigen/teichoic acid export membrane protein